MLHCKDASVPAYSPFNFAIKPDAVIDNELGFIMLGASQYGDELGVTGDGILAAVTFKIVRAPPSNSSLFCNIAFHQEDTYLNDPDMNPISFISVIGFYEYSWSSVNLLAHGIVADNKAFTVVTESNCTLTPVPMNFNFKELSFNATSVSDEVGYVNVTVLKSFMWGDFIIKVDGRQQSFTISSNITCTFLYFEFLFTVPNQKIVISAEFVVAEYPFGPVMLAMLLVTTFVVLSLNFHKNKR
uniref:Cohesin domain-containing protein n=1 Tax=candidate division WWE3 bacterium TaxID=2053526 RepID=A0A7C4TJI6_UNCKA